MTQPHLIETLREVGLSDNQARVYLASLSLGPAKATQIASHAGVKRTTVYPVIRALCELGLITEQLHGIKTLYVAEPPERLDDLVDQRHRKLKLCLSELAAVQRFDPTESAIKYYEGLEALKAVYRGLLTDAQEGDDYFIVSSGYDWFDQDPEFFQQFIADRAKLNFKIRALLVDTPYGRSYLEKEEEYNLKTKLLPGKTIFSTNLVIIPQKVLLHQLEAPVWGIVIENRNIVRTHQELFELLWKNL